MKIFDVKEKILGFGFHNIICESFSKSLGVPKEELEALFEKIMDEKINELGKSIAESTTSQKNMNKLRGLSLDEFMKDNDKIIKDK
tara:strand:+ start:1417 stop:1674 length:258 start_codon:yes stop_codon:yes gene_type:complete